MVQPWLSLCTLFFFLFSSSCVVMALCEPSPSPMDMQQAPLSSSSKAKVIKAIVAATSTTLVIALVVFFILFYRKKFGSRWRGKYESSFRRETVVIPDEFKKYGGKVKGLVVEENGGDVVCMTKLDDRRLKNEFPKVMLNPSYEVDEEEKMIDTDTAVERSKKSESREDFEFLNEPSEKILPQEPPPEMVSMKQTTPNPPPPPPLLVTSPAPLNMANTKSEAPPGPPPPPPAAGVSVTLLKPPRGNMPSTSPENWKGAGFGQVQLRPLHWDKVIMADCDHSMVWDQIKDGSLRFDDELIETLFGYTTTNRKLPDGNNVSSTSATSGNTPTAQTFILDPRKSQNSAIVLKSLGMSRSEIIGALHEGHGLSTETLEKLTKIGPTREEEAKILHFNGNPMRLPDAESFLYCVLKAVPSAFIRINLMLFRSNYDWEFLNLKESLQMLESACRELRNRGLFLKLLEAILKAGNKMNAGTARGNALGFNLSALQKLSDVKTTDGKTTLLHFVVEQVARSEGRRHTINRMLCTNGDVNSDKLMPEEKDREYLMLGLPALAALGSEFSNVKTAATIEYESFINLCSNLSSRVAESKQLLTFCGRDSDETDFVTEMKGCLEERENELKVVREEQIRVMVVVKKTTDYYKAGASKARGANPLQLFVIVKDFLDMVDRVRADITRKLQLTNGIQSAGSSAPPTPPRRNPLKLINFRSQFMSSEMCKTTSSSESDDDF